MNTGNSIRITPRVIAGMKSALTNVQTARNAMKRPKQRLLYGDFKKAEAAPQQEHRGNGNAEFLDA